MLLCWYGLRFDNFSKVVKSGIYAGVVFKI